MEEERLVLPNELFNYRTQKGKVVSQTCFQVASSGKIVPIFHKNSVFYDVCHHMGNAAYAGTAMLSQRKMTWAHLVPSFFPAIPHISCALLIRPEKKGNTPKMTSPRKQPTFHDATDGVYRGGGDAKERDFPDFRSLKRLASLCIGADHPFLLKNLSSKKTRDEYWKKEYGYSGRLWKNYCLSKLTPAPRWGALGYFLGWYVPPGTPNWHPVLKKNSPKIDTPF